MVTDETKPERPSPSYSWPALGRGAHFYLSTPELNQRLDLLQHLTANSDRIALVKGTEGIGKSALIERFQALAADHWKLCRIDANPMMQPEQLFSALARCFSLPAADDRLIDRLPRHFQDLRQAGSLPVILIDDAQLLPVTSIISLFRLYELRPSAQALVRLILFATPQIDDLLATPQAMAMNLQALQVMELPPLGAQQTGQLAQQRLADEGSAEGKLSESQVAKIYNDTAGVPGEIVKRVDRLSQRMGKTPPARSKSARRSWVTLAGAMLIGFVLLLMLIYQDHINALFDGGEPTQQDIALSPVERESVIPLQLPDIEEGLPAELPALVSEGAGVPELSLPEVTQTRAEEGSAVIEAVALPPVSENALQDEPAKQLAPVAAPGESHEATPPLTQVEAGVTTTMSLVDPAPFAPGGGATKESSALAAAPEPVEQAALTTPPAVVVPQPLPSGAVEGEVSVASGSLAPPGGDSVPLSGHAQVLEPPKQSTPQALAGVGQSALPIDAAPPAVGQSPPLKPVEKDTVSPKALPGTPSQVAQKTVLAGRKLKREPWLLQQKSSAYTLQLLGVQEEEAVHRFLQRHRLRGETAYFRTLRDNLPWFSVVYGIYPDRAAALAARTSLPAALRSSGVWPRSLASVQEAIDAD